VAARTSLASRRPRRPSASWPNPSPARWGQKGVHVAYLLIDAVIDVPWARERMKDAPDDVFIQPAAIADEAWHIAHQPRSAWSFLVEVRPFGESW
jgi:hypothetical protein